jgi:ABC-type phosphate transport system permease subunit
LANAIVGSLMIVASCSLLSTPIGVLAGVYLSEYGDRSKSASVTRFVNDIMLSAPSIVIGLFVYALVVVPTKQFSGWAGTIALSLIAIPVVAETGSCQFARSSFCLGGTQVESFNHCGVKGCQERRHDWFAVGIGPR